MRGFDKAHGGQVIVKFYVLQLIDFQLDKITTFF